MSKEYDLTFRSRDEAVPRTPSSKHYEALLQMSDEDLMSQFQVGTVEAFDILVSRYKEPLTNYIYRFLGDMKECEDLRNRHSYRRIAKFSTWLYTTAGKLARSEYRKRKRRRLYSLQSVNRDDEEYEVEIPDETFFGRRKNNSRYTNRKSISPALNGMIKPVASTDYQSGDVQIEEPSTIHQVSNLQPGRCDAISLHVYLPPLGHMNITDFTI
jgi:hypothetical protein